ncbi:MAG: hypothetical protein KAQ98_06720 [Bacteriovoracaceae bacterium]|nr:hypothetical protein [Bacteriovoracaceae bacterium]
MAKKKTTSKATKASTTNKTTKKSTTRKASAQSKAKAKPTVKKTITKKNIICHVERLKMVKEVAFLNACKRNFSNGDELGDWLSAEKEVSSRLSI